METLLSKVTDDEFYVEGLCYLLKGIGDYLMCGGTRRKFNYQLRKSSNGRNFLNGRLGCCHISLSQHLSFESRPPMLILVPITQALGSDRVANSGVPLIKGIEVEFVSSL